MNKLLLNIVLAIVATLCVSSCGYDNFDEPDSMLTGRMVYKGQPLQLPGSANLIQLQAYQSGYQLTSPITIYVGQDGSFSTRLFNGHYKIVTKDNNGPWVNSRDTVEVDLNGSTNVDIPVTPYFLLSDFGCSLSGNTLTANFTVERIVADAKIDHAAICLGTTAFVDEQNNAMEFQIPADKVKEGANSFTTNLSDDQVAELSKPSVKKIIARAGLRTVGADRSIYTEIVKLK
ncbi:MAG: DUF3823 domain-containing protein [Prevotella sp.]|jgi:hypothetical protein